MGFVKVIKNKAYYKRFQVKPRRRRENKTDYYARKRLIWQDKNKYDTPKYRLVVRFTNRDVICAVVASDLGGDRVIKSAYGHELRRYGLKFGFKSWAATYATGLLLARRVNAHFRLPFQGKKDAAGEFFNLGEVDEMPVDDSGFDLSKRRPFKAVLDVGLHRTTTGSRLFAAVKGACDGGLNVPHSPTRFPGAPKAGSEEEIDYGVVRDHVYGKHIGDYMTQLAEEDEEAYGLQFAVAKKEGITGDKIEGIFQKLHEAIRADTSESLLKPKKDDKQLGYFKVRTAPKAEFKSKHFGKVKLSKQQRIARVVNRLAVRDARLAQLKKA